MNEEEGKETDAFTSNESSRKMKVKNRNSQDDLRQKNQLMKIALIVLIVLVLALILIICVLAIVRPTSADGSEDKNDPETCYSEACINTAKYLHQNMDLSVDPCEDFYNFTCGSWGIHNPRPKSLKKDDSWGVNDIVEERLNKEILEILKYKGENVPQSMMKARNFYTACTNTEFRDEYGLEALRKIIQKIGGFPMLSNNWNQANFDWQTAFVYCDVHINVARLFFSFKIDRQNEEELTRNIKLYIPDSFYVAMSSFQTAVQKAYNITLNGTVESDFRESVKKRLTDLHTTLSNEEIDRDLDDFIAFEKKLAAIAYESAINDGDDVVLSIAEMNQQYKDIDWLRIFSDIFKTVNITITDNENIYNDNPTFFKKLGKLLKDTSKRTLANYISYSVITEFGAKAIQNFNESDNSKVDMEELEKDCVKATEKFFRVAINYWYTKVVLGKDAMHDLKGFLKQIKAALTLTINTNKWMQEKTKQQAQLKLNRMIHYLGRPIEVQSDDELDQYYQKTGSISSENYVHAFKKMMKWRKQEQLLSLRDTQDKKVAKPSEVNAFYSPYDNKIEILIGFLSPPNFYPNAPLAVNVPAIGSTIGHEITHGFDDSGSQFDSKGYKKNWWDKRTQKIYKSKVNCFIKQYSEFIEPKTGKHVDGDETVGENIADNGAIHQAYTAYKLYSALKHPEKDLKLPNQMNKYTKDQLFFIAYANTYCNDDTKEHMIDALTDEHPPDAARVIIPLQNSEEFSKAFQCQVGTRMNPEKKCLLW